MCHYFGKKKLAEQEWGICCNSSAPSHSSHFQVCIKYLPNPVLFIEGCKMLGKEKTLLVEPMGCIILAHIDVEMWYNTNVFRVSHVISSKMLGLTNFRIHLPTTHSLYYFVSSIGFWLEFICFFNTSENEFCGFSTWVILRHWTIFYFTADLSNSKPCCSYLLCPRRNIPWGDLDSVLLGRDGSPWQYVLRDYVPDVGQPWR